MHDETAIDRIRAFSRFYTRFAGVLNEGLLKSPFSPTEARVIYELGSRRVTTAATLAADLGLDPAHLSRMLRRFSAAGLVARHVAEGDRRERKLMLSDEGRTAFEALDGASRREIGELLDRLSPTERGDVVRDMQSIRSVLDPRFKEDPAVLIRSHRNGDASWIVHRQALLYAAEYGWNGEYEALVTGIVAEFLGRHDPKREHFWVAERGGVVAGSVFLVDAGEGVGKLRLLYVEPSARGLGIGGRLVETCMDFAREAGYRRMTLWTNDVLAAARHIYRRAGFELQRSEPHHSFGHDLVGETWERDLDPRP